MPQVLDQSRRRRLEPAVAWGTGYEALLCLVVLDLALPPSRYEQGARVARFRRRLEPGPLRTALEKLHTDGAEAWSHLVGLLSEAPNPCHTDSLIRYLRRLDPEQVKDAMLGSYSDPEQRVAGRRLRSLPAGEVVNLVVGAVETLPVDLYLEGNVEELLARSAAGAAALAREVDAITLIERLTRGLVYAPEPGIDRVLLVPSLVHRPWTLIEVYKRTKVFCYPAALAAQLDTPDERLVAINSALGDRTRLRILQRLARGRATVGVLANELGLAKSTVHAHLLVLRTSGLVRQSLTTGFELAEIPDLTALLRRSLSLG